MNDSPIPTALSIRRKGLLKFLLGAVVFAIGLTIPLFVLPYFHQQLTPFGLIPFAVPGAYAIAGFIEFVTGIRFGEFARRWDELKGWQRGIFGTFIVLVALVVIITVGALIAVHL